MNVHREPPQKWLVVLNPRVLMSKAQGSLIETCKVCIDVFHSFVVLLHEKIAARVAPIRKPRLRNHLATRKGCGAYESRWGASKRWP